MIKAYKFKLKPSTDQLLELQEIAGATRWVYNYLLGLNHEKYEYTNQFAFYHEMSLKLPKLKQEHIFLKQAPSQSLQQAAKRLDLAIRAVWEQGNGFPKFRSRKDPIQSFSIPQTNNHIKQNKKEVIIPKIGAIKWKRHRNISGVIKNLIIKQEQDKWYAILVCKMQDTTPILDVNPDNSIGLDLGLIDFAVLSDEQVIPTKKFYRLKLNQLKSKQRKLSHRRNKGVKGSRRYSVLKKRVARLHTKVKNQRMDFLHQVSAAIAKLYLFVGVEDLNIKGMIKNQKLSKSISDQGWGMFLSFLAYKCQERGGQMIKIDRWSPSTKQCSCCGKKQNITLDERTYRCANCGLEMDRDLNAAFNILTMALAVLDRCGTHRITGFVPENAQGDGSIGEVGRNTETRYPSTNCEKRLGLAEEATTLKGSV